jgi:hypothetical protein
MGGKSGGKLCFPAGRGANERRTQPPELKGPLRRLGAGSATADLHVVTSPLTYKGQGSRPKGAGRLAGESAGLEAGAPQLGKPGLPHTAPA